VVVGELGLLGELRPVGGLDRRLREAARLGFDTAIVPASRPASPPEVPGLRIVQAGSLRDALDATLGGSSGKVMGVAVEPSERVVV
jgi:DNA repair protein RadA/Sms